MVLSRGLGCLERLERSPVPFGASQSLPCLISIIVQSAKQAPRHASGFRLARSPAEPAGRVSILVWVARPAVGTVGVRGRVGIFARTARVVEQRDAADKVGNLLAEPPLQLISVLGRPSGAVQ